VKTGLLLLCMVSKFKFVGFGLVSQTLTLTFRGTHLNVKAEKQALRVAVSAGRRPYGMLLLAEIPHKLYFSYSLIYIYAVSDTSHRELDPVLVFSSPDWSKFLYCLASSTCSFPCRVGCRILIHSHPLTKWDKSSAIYFRSSTRKSWILW
jgi:hypothetical protein